MNYESSYTYLGKLHSHSLMFDLIAFASLLFQKLEVSKISINTILGEVSVMTM